MSLGLNNLETSESRLVSVSTTLENMSLGLDNLKNVVSLSVRVDS